VEKTCAFCPEEPEGAVVALSTVQRIAQNTTGDSDSEESERDAALSNSVSEESEHAAALSDSDSEESERDVALSTVGFKDFCIEYCVEAGIIVLRGKSAFVQFNKGQVGRITGRSGTVIERLRADGPVVK